VADSGHPKNQMGSSNEKRRKRYADDVEYRETVKGANRRYKATHKEEINESRRRSYATDPEYRARCIASHAKGRRANSLKFRYGISLREYELRLALQNGACAICRKKPKGLLCVDHCHLTGKVRGLLCSKCNSALGFYGDDPKLAQAGADYLAAFYDSLEPTGDIMTSSDEQTETGKTSRLMRQAILLELEREPGQVDDGATNRLRLVARQLVDKAVEGDIQAIKEVLDRIDGKSVPGAGDAGQGPRQVNIRWKNSGTSSAVAS